MKKIYTVVGIFFYALLCANEDRISFIKEIGRTADLEKAQVLLSAGRNCTLAEKTSMLYEAISSHSDSNQISKEKRLSFIDFLLQAGAPLLPHTDDWMYVPMLAASTKDIEVMQLVLKHGGDVNTTHSGWTALRLAAWNGKWDNVQFLLNQKVIKIDDQDGAGETALMKAAFWSYHIVIKLLLEYKAQVHIKNSAGKTALNIALHASEQNDGGWRNTKETIRLLEAAQKVIEKN